MHFNAAYESLKEAIILDPMNPKYTNVMKGLKCKVEQSRLQKWMKKNSADVKNIEFVNYSEHGRSIHASNPINSGETALFVPHHLMMTVDRAKKLEFGEEMAKRNLESKLKDSNLSFLAVHLLQE